MFIEPNLSQRTYYQLIFFNRKALCAGGKKNQPLLCTQHIMAYRTYQPSGMCWWLSIMCFAGFETNALFYLIRV